MTGAVVVLEPGDERAQKIAKAMASQTASDILTLLATGTKSLTDITGQTENSPYYSTIPCRKPAQCRPHHRC